MSARKGVVTGREKTFATTMAATGDVAYSATKAGYRSPASNGYAVAERPAVQAEIARTQMALLFEVGLPLAVKTHIAILEDVKTPPGAKVQAVKLMYDRTLGVENQGDRREPHEMSADELARAIDEMKREISDRARPVIIDEEKIADPDLFD